VHKVARFSAEDRRDIFSEAAAKLGIRPSIIEKDFWVCFVLKMLFAESPFKESLVFKGGTSLSKVYGLIDRFSEDIDLVLDWEIIGFGEGLKDPMQSFQSKSKRDQFNKEINRVAAQFISGKLRPQIDDLVRREEIGLSATVDSEDPQVINIHYPAAFTEAYIRPEVRLEIGPLASWVPSSAHVIQPYAFDVFPEIFEDPFCPVIAIAAERTFWEKATILHQEAHRSALIPKRYSRHYYDLQKLALSPIRDAAIARLALLPDVVEFKKRFYPSTWARYDLATPGSFKLLPTSATQIANLERDYEDMQVMLFGQPPAFGSILDELQHLEEQINTLPPLKNTT
jgi:hypothetical protein